MKITECREGLFEALFHSRIAARPQTPLEREAFAVVEMAMAYQKDGSTFYETGDFVNALAAFCYGAGWLHFGISSGLINDDNQRSFCPFSGPREILPLSLAEKLGEKTRRYEQLLNTARTSVECAGEMATIRYHFAGKVLFIAELYATQGTGYLRAGNCEDALACFSYGHGWLDAGVICGYFRIMAHHDIFTL